MHNLGGEPYSQKNLLWSLTNPPNIDLWVFRSGGEGEGKKPLYFNPGRSSREKGEKREVYPWK